MNYKSFSLKNFKNIEEVRTFLPKSAQNDCEAVGNVLPFKTNNYVVKELINWDNVPNDPIFQLTFPQKNMLNKEQYNKVETAINAKVSKTELTLIVNKIRYQLNPYSSDILEGIVPKMDEQILSGIQHKYKETVLFFPSRGQTCHAYCSFCFRWPQFVGVDELKFAMKETELLVEYIKNNKQVTDILITGGDALIMSAQSLASYIDPLINSDIPNLKTIRLGTKSLSFWPYKFLTDKDSDDLMRLFERVQKKGINLAFMAHFSHPVELQTKAVEDAIKRILNTGTTIRTQSPVMKHINDDASIWRDMWQRQVELGCIPYYMFIARDTGAQNYFAVPLERAWKIYNSAYKQISGVGRTARGPSMSSDPGKIQILGINEIYGEKVFTLNFIQGKNPNWVGRPFFAKFNPEAIWLDDLEPAFKDEKFFFQNETTDLEI